MASSRKSATNCLKTPKRRRRRGRRKRSRKPEPDGQQDRPILVKTATQPGAGSSYDPMNSFECLPLKLLSFSSRFSSFSSSQQQSDRPMQLRTSDVQPDFPLEPESQKFASSWENVPRVVSCESVEDSSAWIRISSDGTYEQELLQLRTSLESMNLRMPTSERDLRQLRTSLEAMNLRMPSFGQISAIQQPPKIEAPHSNPMQPQKTERPKIASPERFRTEHCKYFIRGRCTYGQDCQFLHAPLTASDQLVTVSKIPEWVTGQKLAESFHSDLGMEIVNHCRIVNGTCKNLAFKRLDHAQRLLKQGSVKLRDFTVKVEPYVDIRDEEVQRTVFIGGLPHFLTAGQLIYELKELGFVVVNFVKIKQKSFAPKVVLKTKEQASNLIRMKMVPIMGINVQIRPYIEKDSLQRPELWS